MKAEDTVMHLDDIDNGRMPDSYASLRKALEKQAEISFKAGMRKVVEWLEENAYPPAAYENIRRFRYDDWQAFLKEKGL